MTVRTALHRPAVVEQASPSDLPPSTEALAIDAPTGPATRLTLRGVVDDAVADSVRAVIGTLLEPGAVEVLVDLSDVTLLASAAVRVLHEAVKEAHGKKLTLRLVAPNGSTAHEVLTLAALPHTAGPLQQN